MRIWTQQACEAIYEQAAVIFRSQPLPDWLTFCEFVRRKLGVWQSFVSQEAITLDGQKNVIFLEGKAGFGAARYDVIIAWKMEGRQPRFLSLSLGQNGNTLQTIPPLHDHLLDSPPWANVNGNS